MSPGRRGAQTAVANDGPPDPGRASGVIYFRVENVVDAFKNDPAKTIFSPTHFFRNLPWFLQVSQNVKDEVKFLGIYLCTPYCKDNPPEFPWKCEVKYKTRLLSEKGPSHCQGLAIQMFEPNIAPGIGWGSAHFIAWNDLINPEKGYLKDGAIRIEVRMEAVGVPEGGTIVEEKAQSTFSLVKGDRRSSGLLSSILQIMYTVAPFRKAMLTKTRLLRSSESTDTMRLSVSDALQETFGFLSCFGNSSAAERILDALDWNLLDALFIERDAYNFLEAVFTVLVNECEDNSMIRKLFCGDMNVIAKVNRVGAFDFSSKPFWGIHIDVNGTGKNVAEILDEKTKWRNVSTSHPDKKLEFISFPLVLFLHLKRYDEKSDTEIKDAISFSAHLDLQKYMKPPEGKRFFPKEHEYLLCGVLAVADNTQEQVLEYSLFLNRGGNGQCWTKYYKDEVLPCTEADAVSGNFGTGGSGMRACLLMYVKKTALSWILQEPSVAEVPSTLRTALKTCVDRPCSNKATDRELREDVRNNFKMWSESRMKLQNFQDFKAGMVVRLEQEILSLKTERETLAVQNKKLLENIKLMKGQKSSRQEADSSDEEPPAKRPKGVSADKRGTDVNALQDLTKSVGSFMEQLETTSESLQGAIDDQTKAVKDLKKKSVAHAKDQAANLAVTEKVLIRQLQEEAASIKDVVKEESASLKDFLTRTLAEKGPDGVKETASGSRQRRGNKGKEEDGVFVEKSSELWSIKSKLERISDEQKKEAAVRAMISMLDAWL